VTALAGLTLSTLSGMQKAQYDLFTSAQKAGLTTAQKSVVPTT